MLNRFFRSCYKIKNKIDWRGIGSYKLECLLPSSVQSDELHRIRRTLLTLSYNHYYQHALVINRAIVKLLVRTARFAVITQL